MQAVLRTLFPDQCVNCRALVESAHGLCGACWRETEFITGPVCDACGVPLMGPALEGDLCDRCLAAPPPWSRGRAAVFYRGVGRRIVLALKHGDRTDLALPAGAWLARAAAPLTDPETILVPIPVHRFRLFRRRYNQAALLAAALAHRTGLWHVPDALIRSRATPSQDGRSRQDRFENLDGAIAARPGPGDAMRDRKVLLVDDVMTSGATFHAAAQACRAAGAYQVSVTALARVAPDAYMGSDPDKEPDT